ncbi:MAG: ABC transporter substrate-binding protein [Treponemataceae bacterium]|nr:ABC transporter substrate-binding protein [Treponemataceae bacterium]
MKRFIAAICAASLVLFCASLTGCQKQKEENELNVYSIIHDEETKALCDLFTQQTGIKVNYLRASTGELVNRVISEKNAPQADVLLGGATNYHIQAAKEGALESYASPIAADFPAYAKSADSTWTGFCVLTLGIGVNKTRFEQKFPNQKLPQTWDDLANPVYKNEIVMTNPLASSTAYLFVQNQLQRLGWDKGWEYLIALSQLVGQFPDSGSAPPKLLGTGEYSIGVAYLHALAKYKAQGFDIELIAPPQTVGDVDCISIMKNAQHPNAAKKFVDFILDAPAQGIMAEMTYTIPVNKNANVMPGSVSLEKIDLIDYDANKASAEKDEVIKKWSAEVK